MYVRLVRFSLMDGKREAAKSLADDLVPAISSQPGCKTVTCFGDDESGEYGLYVLWESEAAANSAMPIIAPRLDHHLKGNVKQPPDRRLFEVLASR